MQIYRGLGIGWCFLYVGATTLLTEASRVRLELGRDEIGEPAAALAGLGRISQQIEQLSEGTLTFNVASFYPLLYRLEKRGWIEGTWVEKEGQRRRRYYKLTASGKAMLKEQRRTWAEFVTAMARITGVKHA